MIRNTPVMVSVLTLFLVTPWRSTAQEVPKEEISTVETPPEEAPAEKVPAEETVPPEAIPDDDLGETEVEPWVPGMEEEADAAYEEAYAETYDEKEGEPIYDDRPFGKGTMEPGLQLGGWGGGGNFSLTVGASFAYYVIAGLAPGLQVVYQTTFSDIVYPQSVTLLPFLKYVFFRSHKFSPYIMVQGGREFQWAGTDDPDKGYTDIHSWIVGGGPGVHIGFSRSFGISIQVLFLYYFFDEPAYVVDLRGDAEVRDGQLSVPISIGFSFLF